ncbi:unnamed protein product [Linum tenue]|uniref:Uncharacterized protein n=1 Tax=Linum tenue TaxID=586396 RepID=A0AAV0I3I4_9ROSI|nr:unnamed protein product [Linum tenue]
MDKGDPLLQLERRRGHHHTKGCRHPNPSPHRRQTGVRQ